MLRPRIEATDLRTPYETIVNRSAIGKQNPISLPDLLTLAGQEQSIASPSRLDAQKVLVLGIDLQNDFMENGSLPVPGSHQDVGNFTRFIYNNLLHITKIGVSLDTHQVHQVFHPAWWKDTAGHAPEPLTVITSKQVSAGNWVPRFAAEETAEYVKQLERMGKKQLMIWPYHCIEGTTGAALEGQFSNMVYFHSCVREAEVLRIVKGLHPLSEMYGIIKPEYAGGAGAEDVNQTLLDELALYDKIVIGGEAKSHCVLESVIQIVEHFQSHPGMTEKIYLLEDCMSPIPGFETATERSFMELSTRYGVQRVLSTELVL